MNGGELHRLGRRLIELSADVTGEPGDLELAPSERAVLEDVIEHPFGSIGEVAQRTRFAQSRVSVVVSELERRGVVAVTVDPSDTRRRRVSVTEQALAAIGRRASRGIDDAVGRAVTDSTKAARVTALLEELSDLLL